MMANKLFIGCRAYCTMLHMVDANDLCNFFSANWTFLETCFGATGAESKMAATQNYCLDGSLKAYLAGRGLVYKDAMVSFTVKYVGIVIFLFDGRRVLGGEGKIL